MKSKQLFSATVIMAFIFTMYGCRKPIGDENCRTCTAFYSSTGGNTTIATGKACSTQAEEDFKNEYHYAEVKCER